MKILADVSPDMQEIAQLLTQVKMLAKRYQLLTGRPLGITGEIGEFSAITLLGLQLAPVRTAGYDAFEIIDGQKKTYQIKSRCISKGHNLSQRMGQIKVDHDWDAVLFVRLDSDYEPLEIMEASRKETLKALTEPGSKSRNERGALGVNKFYSISKHRWPPESPKENSEITMKTATTSDKKMEIDAIKRSKFCEQLIIVARQGRLATYSEVAPLLGLSMKRPPDRTRISEILTDLSKEEFARGRPLLAAIVVSKEKRLPGPGFFNLARELGKLDGDGEMEEKAFFEKEVGKVHAYWQEHQNN